MNPLLLGRWQAYKFEINGEPTIMTKGHGNLYKFNEDGTMDYAYFFNGNWSMDKLKRVVVEVDGGTVVKEVERVLYTVQHVSQDELQLAVYERARAPILVYFCRRLPDIKT